MQRNGGRVVACFLQLLAYFLVELCVAVRYGGDFLCVDQTVSAACGALISIEGFDADHCVSRL